MDEIRHNTHMHEGILPSFPDSFIEPQLGKVGEFRALNMNGMVFADLSTLDHLPQLDTDWHVAHMQSRIFNVKTGDTDYILKFSRKSPRFAEPHNMRSPATAKEEYDIARHLHEQRSVEYADIRVTWERPVAVIELDNGDQGVLFSKIEGFSEGSTEKVVKRILDAMKMVPLRYQDEFREVNTWLNGQDANLLSFDSFLSVRALWMYQSAEYLREQSKISYSNQDNNYDSVLYTIDPNVDSLFTVHGYDVEYYEKTYSVNKSRQEYLKRTLRSPLYDSVFHQGIDPSQRKMYEAYAARLLAERGDF